MKKKGNILVGLGIVFALIIGFLIGISVEFPKNNNSSVSGTIGKINNYRNAQNSKSDIQLQNELASDTTKLKSVQYLLDFYYFTAVKMSGDIQLAIDEANANEAFKASNQNLITGLTNYGKYLSSARTDLLLAISVCKTPEKTDPLLLKEMLNQANNVIAQINYKNRTVLDFIDVLASYAEKNKTGQIQELMRVHDLLMLSEINTAVMTRNKLIINLLDKKQLLAGGKIIKLVDQKKMEKLMQQDVEKLGSADMEKLGIMPALDSQKLGILAGDAEKLNDFLAADVEKLGTIHFVLDAEKLGTIHFVLDAEKLGQYNDTEILGIKKN